MTVDRELTSDEFDRLLSSVVVPVAPLVQPENDLKPDAARLAFDLRMLELRVAALERKAGIHDDAR